MAIDDAIDADALGIPRDAMARLAELEPGKAGRIFTSDLTVNEFLLVRQAGFTPLGLVLGTSVYHCGFQFSRWNKNQELDVLSQAMYHARELAMTRMQAEALALHADGIVGVRLSVEFKEWGSETAEFLAVGTAVKADDGKSWRNDHGQPFTSDLTGQDFCCAMRRSVISPAQRGEIGGISLDPMANSAPKGNIEDRSMPGN